MTDHYKQVQDFLKKTGTEFSVVLSRRGTMWGEDKEQTRDIYTFTLTRKGRVYSADFGQSIVCSTFIVRCGGSRYVWEDDLNNTCKTLSEARRYAASKLGSLNSVTIEGGHIAPTAYDVLSCLQKHAVGTFEDFCADFGYDTDSAKAKRTYDAVLFEFKSMQLIFNDEELEELTEVAQ